MNMLTINIHGINNRTIYYLADYFSLDSEVAQYGIARSAGMTFPEYLEIARKYHAHMDGKQPVFTEYKDITKFKSYIEACITAQLLVSCN